MGISNKMIHFFSILLLLFLFFVPYHARVLDDPDYNPEDYTDINLHGLESQTEAEVDCESRSFQIYKAMPRSPPARRPYNCSLPSDALLLAACDSSVDVTVTFNVTLSDVVVYYVGVDAHDPTVCYIYRVFSEENYDASLESEEDDRRRGEWRKEMKLNRQRGTTIPYPPQPTIHSDINELDETKKRPMPDDVRLLPVDDGDFEDDYSTLEDYVTALMREVVSLANAMENEERVKNFEKTRALSNIIGGSLMKFAFFFMISFLFTYYK
ncbi:hypothetical protein PRIPAC_98097 [Pristionchus pacificus]|uniref:Uncharacterized protein n=1 Tax=Pristionchus pacificus TaxID=54126 RepID=A0A2A6BZA3_PRIPA|nr:hypothetical protein PRIPAC_98097 [Pristionchus pacificus]|eukprot:PDM71101.1 hypothetical protein PRIPAC_46479 [Pristionchus pacificus]